MLATLSPTHVEWFLFGATILRWDEMAHTFWRQTWTGF